jgi:hypothetical protein
MENGEERRNSVSANRMRLGFDRDAGSFCDPINRRFLYIIDTLGAEGVLPSRYIVSSLRVLKQFAHTLPSG